MVVARRKYIEREERDPWGEMNFSCRMKFNLREEDTKSIYMQKNVYGRKEDEEENWISVSSWRGEIKFLPIDTTNTRENSMLLIPGTCTKICTSRTNIT